MHTSRSRNERVAKNSSNKVARPSRVKQNKDLAWLGPFNRAFEQRSPEQDIFPFHFFGPPTINGLTASVFKCLRLQNAYSPFVLLFCREGSVISSFNVTYSAVDSFQIVSLQEEMAGGTLGDTPVELLNISTSNGMAYNSFFLDVYKEG